MEECLRSVSHQWSRPSWGQSQEPTQWSASSAGSKHTKCIIGNMKGHISHECGNSEQVVTIDNGEYRRYWHTFAWVRAAFFTFSWDWRSLKFLDQPSVLVSLAPTPRSSYNDMVVPELKRKRACVFPMQTQLLQYLLFFRFATSYHELKCFFLLNKIHLFVRRGSRLAVFKSLRFL